MSIETAPVASRAEPGFVEFVALIAFLMALTALAIDSLLPAFPAIRADFQVSDQNDLQYLVYFYMIGFAAAQLIYGPMSDVLGRRPVLIGSLVVFAIGAAMAIFAYSFEALIIARIVQGLGAAGARVLAISIVRDRFGGRDMARVMSFAMMVFITIPVFAPAFGSLVLLIGGWHMQFAVILALIVMMIVWFSIRMPETLHPEYRFPFSVARIVEGARLCVTNRVAVGYSTAMGLMLGCLMAYIGSAQQIFETEVYGLGPWFPLAFGLVAVAMGFGSYLNSLVVRRVGMRRLAHGATLGYAIAAAVQLALSLAYDGHPPLILFGVILAVSSFLFSMTLPNFNALAMEPLGPVAGTASSLIGFYTTLIGALLGLAVGQSFDGTVTPLGLGFLVYALLALAVVYWTERGKLFQPQTPEPSHPT